MKIALMLGHWGKRHRQRDRGAVWKEYTEAYIALEILTKTALILDREYTVFILAHGDYKERQQFANDIGAQLLLSFHLNSAEKPGDYGMVIYDARNPMNSERAHAFAKHLTRAAGIHFVIKGLKHGERGWNNIQYTRMPAFILEFGFINNPTHITRISDENVQCKIANAIKRAIEELWLEY